MASPDSIGLAHELVRQVKLLSRLAECSDAARAELLSCGNSVGIDSNALHVGLPLPLCLDVGVTHVVPKGWGLATHLTFRHDCTSRT